MPETVLVLGSGPIRIGQGIEFDYSCVHCVWALRELGYRAIILNNNPETVSTDFDTGDGLYFEPVDLESAVRVYEREAAVGVVVQFGGQTAINLAEPLLQAGLNVLGTSPYSIAACEDRDQFEVLLRRLEIPKPPGRAVNSFPAAQEVAKEIGYPVLVRPSFVLGGRAMEIAYEESQLAEVFEEAEAANPGQPVLVDKYIVGKEAELDVICDGEATLVPGIMEHIERAGVHSGDSMAVYPPVSLSPSVQAQMVRHACRIAREIQVRGLMNLQFVVENDTAYVLEVNPRASRTVPYLSKVTGVPMVQVATLCMMGKSLASQGYASGLWRLDKSVIPEAEFQNGVPDPEPAKFYAVKAPVFSFQKLARVEPSLGPEMKSTGEILGLDFEYEAALYKALVASGIHFRPEGFVVIAVNDQDKPEAIEIARKLAAEGYRLAATEGTHETLAQNGIASDPVKKIQDGSPNLLDLIQAGQVSLMINTPAMGRASTQEAAQIRRACIESGIACVTNIETAAALALAIGYYKNPDKASCLPYGDYVRA